MSHQDSGWSYSKHVVSLNKAHAVTIRRALNRKRLECETTVRSKDMFTEQIKLGETPFISVNNVLIIMLDELHIYSFLEYIATHNFQPEIPDF